MVASYVKSQFDHPRGFVGRLVGKLMAFEHRGSTGWAVAQLEVQHDDRVLEVGFGPGLAIQRIAKIAKGGVVAGVDISEAMVELARERNVLAVQEGRVKLCQGSALSLPHGDESFDKALAIHSWHHWPDPAAGLREMRRVLRSGGTVAIVEGAHFAVSLVEGSRFARDRRDLRQAGEELATRLMEAGFGQVRLTFSPSGVGAHLCALGVK